MSAALTTGWEDQARSPRRQRLVKRLCACGDRLVLEVLIQVAAGAPIDVALEAFCGLDPQDYAKADVASLPIGRLKVVNGGRK